NAVSALALAPDGKTLFSGSGSRTGARDRTVRQWETATGKQIGLFEDVLDVVELLAVSPDGQTLAVTSSSQPPDHEHQLQLLDRATGKEIRKLPLSGKALRVEALVFSPDGKSLAVGGGDGTVRLLDRATLKVRRELSPITFAFEGRTIPMPIRSLV